MSGFDKIEFGSKKKVETNDGSKKTATMEKHSLVDQKNNSFSMTKARKTSKPTFKFSRKALPIIAIVLVLFVLTGIPAFAAYKSGIKTYREAKLIATAMKNQDLNLASDEIVKTKKDLQETQRNLHYLIPYKFVPLIGWYYNDVDHLLQAGSYGLDTAATTIDALKPYVDVLGLKGKGSFTGGSAEDRIQTAVMAASKITPQIDQIGASLVLLQKEIDQVDPNHYPTLIFGKKIKTQLAALKQGSDEAATFITDAKPLVKALPSLLGESEEKKYLILFQNDKELRPTGGFMTAYAVFRIDKGVIHIDRSDDIYNLDNTIANKPSAPSQLQQYLKVSVLNLRDSNISPDYIQSMKTFRSMYESSGSSTNIDGIIAIDTSVLVNTIKILDDQVTVDGITFTTKNDPRCDCPQVIYALEDNISRPVGYVRAERKGFLGDLLSTILTKALSSSPKIYWGPLFQSFIAGSNQKHILFDLYDQNAQQGIQSLNAAGQIHDFDGDYLHINEANLSGAKVNLFMQEIVDSDYQFQGDSVTKTVTIHYKNPHPASDCNLERGGLCLNAEYRDWIRVYVPKGSQLVDSKGSDVKVTTSEDLGKTVFDGFVSVRPQGVATYTLTYKLPSSLSSKSPLPLMIQKQPGTNQFTYNIMVNGRTVDSFPLLTDKELTVKK